MASGSYIERRFADNYIVGDILGRGTFSTVRRCISKSTGNEIAVKMIPSRHLSERATQRLNREIKICRRLSHPNICRFIDSYQEVNFYFLCFELVTGGELFDDIVQRNHYSEHDAAVCISQILVAIRYYQRLDIIHRDLKPENLLLSNKEPNAKIKLTDFGLAIEVNDDELEWYGFAGTSAYMSPEVIRRLPYGKQIDMWACGVILYILLCGHPPFWSKNEGKLFTLIRSGVYDTSSPLWGTLSDEARNLVGRMLTLNPEVRITPNDALKHPWITQMYIRPESIDRSDALDGLRTFNARRKLKSTMLASLIVQGSHRGSARPNDRNIELLTTTYDLTPEVEGPAAEVVEGTEESAPTTSATAASGSMVPALMASDATAPAPKATSATSAPKASASTSSSSTSVPSKHDEITENVRFSFWQWLQAHCVVM